MVAGDLVKHDRALVQRASYQSLVEAMLEAENWKIARMKSKYQTQFAGLNLAIDSLYPHAAFDRMGRNFYYQTIEGKLNRSRKKDSANFA